MRHTVIDSIHVRRPVAVVAPVVTDPHQLMKLMPGFARFQKVQATNQQDGEEWDVYLEVGTLYVGGRVEITQVSDRQIRWQSLRGTQHSFELVVAEKGDGSKITITAQYQFAGWLIGRATERLAVPILHRRLKAALEQMRHHLEFEHP